MIVTKINIHNLDCLKNDNHYKLSKKQKVGSIFLSFLVASAVMSTMISNIGNDTSKPEIEPLVPPFTAEVTLEEINDMNIIINDNDCSDTFFEDVVSNLTDDGIKVTTTNSGIDINQNDVTVIALDQQYSAGPGTIIFAPYDNARVGESDSLALSMQAAFKQNGFEVDELACAQAGFREDENGNIETFFPTDTEEAIDNDHDSSFVTISFGTQNQNAEWVAKSIENGLARQNYYLKNDDSNTDLIYRANSNDNIEDVANYFGTDSNSLKKFNNINNSELNDSEAIVNPVVDSMNAFNSNGLFQIGNEKTRAY